MDLKLPHLGEGADSGTVVNLFVKEGDQVTKDQPILELENEKAVATIPSTAAGKVTQVFVKAGDKITVGQRILSLSGSGEGGGEKAAKVKPQRAKTPAAAAKIEEQEEEQLDQEEQPAERYALLLRPISPGISGREGQRLSDHGDEGQRPLCRHGAGSPHSQPGLVRRGR